MQNLTEKDFENVCVDYLSDDETVVKTHQVGNTVQIIEVDKDTYDIGIFDGKSYEEIFNKYLAECFIESISVESHVIVSTPGIAKYILENDHYLNDEKTISYLNYVKNWCNNHESVRPMYFSEYYEN